MTEINTLRNPAGQFMPGQSGNPRGRPAGARNRASVLAEALADGEAEALVRKAVELALAGNVRLLKTFIELLIAKPKGRQIELEIEPSRESDPLALLEAGMRALCAGEISPAEALPIARFAECSSRVRARCSSPSSRGANQGEGREAARAQAAADLACPSRRNGTVPLSGDERASAPVNRLYPPPRGREAWLGSVSALACAAGLDASKPPVFERRAA